MKTEVGARSTGIGIIAVLTLVIGVLGWDHFQRAREMDDLRKLIAAQADHDQRPTNARALLAVAAGNASLEGTIRDAVHQEMARGRAAADSSGQAAEQPPPERTPEQDAAVARAKQHLSEALARGTLSRNELFQLKADLNAGASWDARHEVHKELAEAFNQHRLVPQGGHLTLP